MLSNFISGALVLGLLHAFEPGHGKGIMASFAFNRRLTTKSVVLFSIFSFITHTFFILIFSIISFFLFRNLNISDFVHKIRLPVLIAMIFVGCYYIILGIKQNRIKDCCDKDNLEALRKINSPKELMMLALVIGLNPCPTSLIVFVNGVSSGKISNAFLSIIFFGLGVAFSMFTILIFIKTIGHKLKYIEKQIILSKYFYQFQGILIIIAGIIQYIHV